MTEGGAGGRVPLLLLCPERKNSRASKGIPVAGFDTADIGVMRESGAIR